MMELNQIFGKVFKQDKLKYQELSYNINKDFYPLMSSQNSDDTTSFVCGLNLKNRLKKSILFSRLLDFDFFCEENARFFIRSANLQIFSRDKSHKIRLSILPLSLELGVALFEGKVNNATLRTFTDYTVELNVYLKDHTIKFIEEFLRNDIFFDREKSIKYWNFLFPNEDFSQIELFNYFNKKLNLAKEGGGSLFHVYNFYGTRTHKNLGNTAAMQPSNPNEKGLPRILVTEINQRFVNINEIYALSVFLDRKNFNIEEEYNEDLQYKKYLARILLSLKESPNIETLLAIDAGAYFTKPTIEREGFSERKRALTTGVTLETDLSYYIPFSLRSDAIIDEGTRRQEQLSNDKSGENEMFDLLFYSGLVANITKNSNERLTRDEDVSGLNEASFNILRKENVFSIRLLRAVEKSNNFVWEMLADDVVSGLSSGLYLCQVVQKKRMIDKMPIIDRYFLLEV